MLGRLLIALSLASALVTAPPVARTRMFCRMTGVEIPPTACTDDSGAPSQQLMRERCCEHRVQAPLEKAKAESTQQAASARQPVAVELHWFVGIAGPAPLFTEASTPPSRPPLSTTRILLI
jgi:hypothetical protein